MTTTHPRTLFIAITICQRCVITTSPSGMWSNLLPSDDDGPKVATSPSGRNGNDKNKPQPSPTYQTLTRGGIYEYYSTQLYPAVLSSLPMLVKKLAGQSKDLVTSGARTLINFVLPQWSDAHPDELLPTMKDLWEVAGAHAPSDFMLRNFDTNGDGYISSAELLNMTEILKHLQVARAPETWATWFRREWPMMDWKVGVFLWQSFGGVLLLLAFLSVIPGRLHGLSGKILRWPVLGITYFLITVELVYVQYVSCEPSALWALTSKIASHVLVPMFSSFSCNSVYVVIRLSIRIAEYLIARPKHRRLRRRMEQSKSYPEWHSYATELDKSQRRDRWLRQVDDHTSKRYNWGFIRELMKDLRRARTAEDSLVALAVLQLCTRKVRRSNKILLPATLNSPLTHGSRCAPLSEECWWCHERRLILVLEYGRTETNCERIYRRGRDKYALANRRSCKGSNGRIFEGRRGCGQRRCRSGAAACVR